MDKDRAERLANSFARAQQLTKIVSTPEFDEYARNVANSDSDISFEGFGNKIVEDYSNRKSMQNVDFSKSKLPKQILDEIKSNPLDGLSADPTMDSFARQISENMKKNSYSEFLSSKQNVQENTSKNNGSNDYEIIKMIVEGVMNKYMEKLDKKIISENSSRKNEVNTMIVGKKFKFIDGSGNIYEAVLKYKGNVNDMKK